jgi:serine phosphatase RsbU (regulator of sigma subunit)
LPTSSWTASPDPSFDRFARIVRDSLGVPVALVSMVEPGRQVFLGAVGLPEPWQSQRQTPLSHSFCQYVVKDDAPLVLVDARGDGRLCDNLAIEDLDVIAYAGFPIHRGDGTPIGSLCAIDSSPREWSDIELRTLADLAVVCSNEVALRESRAELAASVEAATELSIRSRVLLEMSERLAETVNYADIADALQDAAAKNLGCNHAGIWLITGGSDRLAYLPHPSQRWPQAERHPDFAVSSDNPIGAPLAERRPLFFNDRAAQDSRYPQLATPPQDGDGQARAILPLGVGGQPLGTMALLWDRPREFSDEDRASIAALTSYTSQALHRAQLLDERSHVAITMQAALLTELPQPDHLDLVARYRAAVADDAVGGDWYDAVVMPNGSTHLVIGDVMGHDTQAAATMGGLRNMLRTLAWAIDDPPSANVGRLDRAVRDLRLNAYATLVFARIEQGPEDRARGQRTLRWTNAGHPAPILVQADGRCLILDDGAAADCLIGVFPERSRRDQTAQMPMGSTLVLYTDGLIETRDQDLDAGLARLTESLTRHHRLAPGELLDVVLDDLVGDEPTDDVALLAVRFNPQD